MGTQAERRAARERVSAYHQAQLAELLSHVAAAIDRCRVGEIDASTVDETIHHYHRAAGNSGSSVSPAAGAATQSSSRTSSTAWPRAQKPSTGGNAPLRIAGNQRPLPPRLRSRCGGQDYTGPQEFGYSLESADNFFNTADLGVCADCATHDYPNWAMLISYTGASPPGFGSYTSTAVADQAMLIEGVGSDYDAPWPYSGELWLGFNDDAYSGNTSDNFGQVTATVTVTPQA